MKTKAAVVVAFSSEMKIHRDGDYGRSLRKSVSDASGKFVETGRGEGQQNQQEGDKIERHNGSQSAEILFYGMIVLDIE